MGCVSLAERPGIGLSLRAGNEMEVDVYIGGGVITLILVILLLIWLF